MSEKSSTDHRKGQLVYNPFDLGRIFLYNADLHMHSQSDLTVGLMAPCPTCGETGGMLTPPQLPRQVQRGSHPHTTPGWCSACHPLLGPLSPLPAGFSGIRLAGSNQTSHLLLLVAFNKLFTSFVLLLLSHKIRTMAESRHGRHFSRVPQW